MNQVLTPILWVLQYIVMQIYSFLVKLNFWPIAYIYCENKFSADNIFRLRVHGSMLLDLHSYGRDVWSLVFDIRFLRPKSMYCCELWLCWFTYYIYLELSWFYVFLFVHMLFFVFLHFRRKYQKMFSKKFFIELQF